MNDERIEEIREFLNQPDDVYEEAPMIALELLKAVDESHGALREVIGAAVDGDGARFSLAVIEARKVLVRPTWRPWESCVVE